MPDTLDIEAWKAQLRKGAAELAVLATLARGASYGIQLLDQINGAAGLELSEGSIYPLLNRLQKDGKIQGEWVEDKDSPHPRKYYSLTRDGRALLKEMLVAWQDFDRGMHAVLKKESIRARA
jgi:PadR family transcriptional regulator PadR